MKEENINKIEYRQESLNICKYNIPIVIYNNDKWYPIRSLGDNVLLKELTGAQLKKNGYSDFIKIFEIIFDKDNNNIQECQCINTEGLKRMLLNCKLGRLNVQQRINMKKVCDYLNLKIKIDTKETFIYNFNEWTKYDFWSRECIESFLNENNKNIENIKWQRCTKCNKYYPYDEHFFEKEGNKNNKNYLRSICKGCKVWDKNRKRSFLQHHNTELQRVYRLFGENVYNLYKNNNTIEIYKHWKDNQEGFKYPKQINNKNDKIYILKTLFEEGVFEQEKSFTFANIYEKTSIDIKYDSILNLLNKEIYGIEYINTLERAKQLFFKYCEDNFLDFKNDMYNLKYGDIINKCKLRSFVSRQFNDDMLLFIMNLYENQFPAYKFNIASKKYYIDKDKRVKDLKYLIEEDMKIPLEKIPLYLTLTSIKSQPNTSTLYGVLKKYYKNLWEWVNDVYPNKFDERDFDINVIRNTFDSMEEQQIHMILKNKLNNVIYNNRNTENTIILNSMIPDWIVITEFKTYIIEYFGIALTHGHYNQRIKDYIDKSNDKIIKYSHMKNYETIFLYPEDLKDNYKGVIEKIKIIKCDYN